MYELVYNTLPRLKPVHMEYCAANGICLTWTDHPRATGIVQYTATCLTPEPLRRFKELHHVTGRIVKLGGDVTEAFRK